MRAERPRSIKFDHKLRLTGGVPSQLQLCKSVGLSAAPHTNCNNSISVHCTTDGRRRFIRQPSGELKTCCRVALQAKVGIEINWKSYFLIPIACNEKWRASIFLLFILVRSVELQIIEHKCRHLYENIYTSKLKLNQYCFYTTFRLLKSVVQIILKLSHSVS